MISKISGQPDVWIGLWDWTGGDGVFKWVSTGNDFPMDGDHFGEYVDYTNWGEGEPIEINDISGVYAFMHGSNHTNPGSWAVSKNSTYYRHIIEVE